MDLLTILPNFNTKPYTHILPPLERRYITTVDLITLDYLEIAKRARIPPADVRRLCADVVAGLHGDLGFGSTSGEISGRNGKIQDDGEKVDSPDNGRKVLDLSRWNTISTLDPVLDELLGGGIPTGYLTEVTGESGSGKTQFLLNLLLAAQLPSPQGLGRKAIYISTEAPLSTPRLSQILQSHPYLSKLPSGSGEKPSLANVLSITAIDLETQDHIINYQLPVAIQRYNVGLVVIDSIAANYRAEHASNSMQGLSARSGELAKLGHMLRNLAAKEDVAIVVANQVSDRFDRMGDTPAHQPQQHQPQQQHQQHQQHGRFPRGSQTPLLNRHTKLAMMETNDYTPSSSPGIPSSSIPSSSSPSSPSPSQQLQLPAEDDAFDGAYIIGHPVRNESLSLSHQQKFFTGWGDEAPGHWSESQKTPALGFVWSTQIACRIALKKEDEEDEGLENDISRVVVPVQSLQTPLRNVQTDIKPAKEAVTLHSSPPLNSHNETTIPDSTPTIPTTTTTTTNNPTRTDRTKERITKRRIKLVFAPWTSGTTTTTTTIINPLPRPETQYQTHKPFTNELDFEIWKGGLRSVPSRPITMNP